MEKYLLSFLSGLVWDVKKILHSGEGGGNWAASMAID
jgi:hypothetical protein